MTPVTSIAVQPIGPLNSVVRVSASGEGAGGRGFDPLSGLLLHACVAFGNRALGYRFNPQLGGTCKALATVGADSPRALDGSVSRWRPNCATKLRRDADLIAHVTVRLSSQHRHFTKQKKVCALLREHA